jgi:hypothetical protein
MRYKEGVRFLKFILHLSYRKEYKSGASGVVVGTNYGKGKGENAWQIKFV